MTQHTAVRRHEYPLIERVLARIYEARAAIANASGEDIVSEKLTGFLVLLGSLAILAMTVGTVVLFVAFMHRMKLGWLVTWYKVISVFAGWAIVSSVGGLLDTFHHSGGGMISESEGGSQSEDGWESHGDRDVWADEWEYKRSEYGKHVGILAFGLFFWVLMEKKDHDEKVEEECRRRM